MMQWMTMDPSQYTYNVQMLYIMVRCKQWYDGLQGLNG